MVGTTSLHVREPAPRDDGTYAAVTVRDQSPLGVMVWAGRMLAQAVGKAASEIDIRDYVSAEKVSFARWDDVWDYFADREYATLLEDIRKEIAAIEDTGRWRTER
jgi:hypothetical protein